MATTASEDVPMQRCGQQALSQTAPPAAWHGLADSALSRLCRAGLPLREHIIPASPAASQTRQSYDVILPFDMKLSDFC